MSQTAALSPRQIPPLNIEMLEWRSKMHKGWQELRFDRPATFRLVGKRYSGKGVLDEGIATHLLWQGGGVLDAMSAKASKEGLAWLDSPYAREVAFVTGQDAKVRTNQAVIPYQRWTPDFGEHKIHVMLDSFFRNEDDYYYAMMKMMEAVQKREEHKGEEGQPDGIIIREAQRYLKAAASVYTNKTARIAEEKFIEMHDEAVHAGFTVEVDSKTVNTISKNVRDSSDYTFYKNMGSSDMPDSMHHLFYEYPADMFRSLPPWEFILHTSTNAVGRGINEMAGWHVRRGKSLTKKHEIEVEFVGEPAQRLLDASNVGRPPLRKVTKEMHLLMVKMHAEGKTGNETAFEIQRQFKDSQGNPVKLSRQTVWNELERHENAVCGFCQNA